MNAAKAIKDAIERVDRHGALSVVVERRGRSYTVEESYHRPGLMDTVYRDAHPRNAASHLRFVLRQQDVAGLYKSGEYYEVFG